MASTPRRGGGAHAALSESKQSYLAFQEAALSTRCLEQAKAASSRLALGATHAHQSSGISCEGLQWLDTLRHTQQHLAAGPPTASSTQGKKLLRLPPEVIRNIFSFCNMRSLTYDLQLSCRGLRSLARSGPWWDTFALADLIRNDLPVVSPFVVLGNTSVSVREHRTGFWLRHLAEGRWPRAPTVLDLSTCNSLPSLWTGRALRVSAAKGATTLRLSYSDCLFMGMNLFSAPFPGPPVEGPVNITSLDVSFAKCIQAVSLKEFMDALCPALQVLDISGCKSISDDDGATAVFPGVCATLRELVCCAASVSFLADGWGSLQFAALKKLILTLSATLSDASLIAVARCCPNVEVLHISACPQITDTGIGEYLDAIKAHRSDQQVPLMDVAVDDCIQVGDFAITVLLSSCPELRSLSCERLWCVGTFLTNGAVAVPRSLQSFSIAGCLSLLREVMRSPTLRAALQKWTHLLSSKSCTFLVTNKLGGMLLQQKRSL